MKGIVRRLSVMGAVLPLVVAVADGRPGPAPAREHVPKTTPIAATKSRGLERPLAFEPNRGQADPKVRFLTRGTGSTLLLTANEALLKFGGAGEALRMTLVGGNPAPTLAAEDELRATTNYIVGKDRARWRTNIPTYAKVRYRDAYPGIDLIYYGQGSQLEYDFVVAPDRDPRQIVLEFAGASRIGIDASGDLVVRMGRGDVRFHKPVVYQPADGANRSYVHGRFAIKGKNRVGFDIGRYDRARPLVIDPTLSFSTYLGGGNDDNAIGITRDRAGHVYVTGWTVSPEFPTFNAPQSSKPGSWDGYVAAWDTSGMLLYTTYLGGSDADWPYAIAVDCAGHVYVTGRTESPDFPVVNALQPTYRGVGDAFVTALNAADGTLFYSTYLGGSHSEYGFSIRVDGHDNVYVAGQTVSLDFPTTANAWQPSRAGGADGFVAAIDPTGSRFLYSTYLGGSGGEVLYALAVDADGRAFVTGSTYSPDFPVTPNAAQPALRDPQYSDAFVAMLDPTGALRYGTFLGGTGGEDALGIAVDAAGRAYVTGYTMSGNFPTVNAFQAQHPGQGADAFVAAIDSSTGALVYSTYLGGGSSDTGWGIAVDAEGNAYVCGDTASSDFPVLNAVQPTLNGVADAFVTVFDPTGRGLRFSTYLGGSVSDFGSDGETALDITVDDAGSAYVAGWTSSMDFPTVNASQPVYAGVRDAFVAVLTATPAPPAERADAPVINPFGGSYSQPQTITLSTVTTDATIHYTTDGSTPTASSTIYAAPIHLAQSATLRAIATASGMIDSAVTSATFAFQAAAPTFDPPGGSYLLPQRVVLSDASPGATIYYTTDGSTPTTSSSRYTAPILVVKTTTIQAIAVVPGWSQSLRSSAQYTMLLPGGLAAPLGR